MTTGLRILYVVFLSISILFGLWTIWLNLQELIDRSLGHDTYFSQMYHLTIKESICYAIVYLMPFLTLATLGTYFAVKKRKMKAVICYILIFAVFGLKLYTDSLFLLRE